MPVEVRTAREEDREPMHRLGQQAFAVRPGAYDEQADRSGTPLDRRLVATEDGAFVGKLSVWEFGQWFGGRRVPMGGIGGVAVDAAYRRRGAAAALLRSSLEAMHERGEVLSSLYPMNHTLYRRHGWEVAGDYPELDVELQACGALPAPARPVDLRAATEADLPAIRKLTDEASRSQPGNLWHGAEFAARLMVGDPGSQDAYVASVNGVLTGSVTLTHGDSGDDRGMFTVSVRHFVTTDRDAELALWKLLASHYPVARTAEIVAPEQQVLPTLLGERAIRRRGGGWCWMTRLVDARAAVAARGFDDGVTVEVHLDVADPMAPWNAGPHVLRVLDGQGRLEPGGRGTVRVEIGHLSALYTGWSDPRRLAGLGLLPGAGESEVVALDRAFRSRTPWCRDFF